MFNLEATIEKLEAQLPDENDHHEFLTALRARLAAMQEAAAAESIDPPPHYNSNIVGFAGTYAVPEQFPTGTQLGPGGTLSASEHVPTGTDSGQTDPGSPQTERVPLPTDRAPFPTHADVDPIDAKLAALPEDLRDIGEHLQEKVNHRSPFARLTTNERQAILAMFEDHSGPEMVRILAEPPPIGFSFKTSKQALSRFRRDHMRYEMNNTREAQLLAAEHARRADAEAFEQLCASESAFCEATERNIKRRLFEATRNPTSDHNEIRWLITSLALLRKQYANNPGSPAAPARAASNRT